MEKASKRVINFRPLFFCFVSLLFALTTIRYVIAGNIVFIVTDSIIFFGGGLYFLLRKKFTILLLLLSAFAFGVGWHFVGMATFHTNTYTEQCHVVGRISDDLILKENYAYVTLKNVSINDKKEKNISLSIYYDGQNFEVGDVITFATYVKEVKLFELGSFNSNAYRDKIGYSANVNEADILKISHKLTLAEKFRMTVKSKLYENMGEENGAVAYAVLFGDKSGVSPETKDIYRNAGIIHLLTVSGLHISFLLALLGFILKKCRVNGWINFLICFIILLAYAYLCGFSPSVVRAGIMGLVLLGATISGKWYDGLNSFALAGILILIINPLSANDVGFLMSFACVFAIFTIYPLIAKLFRKFLPKYLAEAIAVSISAEIGILPFAAKIFSSVNYLAFILNLIVIPIFSVLYPLLLISTLLTCVMGFMGFMLKVCGFWFTAIEKISGVFANPYFLIKLSPLKIYVVVAFFVLLFVVSRYLMLNKRFKTIAVSVMMVLLCGLYGVGFLPASASSSISFCTKYQNSMILLTNKHKESVIIDLSGETFTRRFLDASNVAKVIAVFGLDKTSITKETMDYLDNPSLVLCESGLGFESEVVVAQDETANVGNFNFTFTNSGLEIVFDETRVFVFASKHLTNAQLDTIADKNFDFVISNKYNFKTDIFSGATNIISYYNTEEADWSVLKSGNGAYKLNENKWRSID